MINDGCKLFTESAAETSHPPNTVQSDFFGMRRAWCKQEMKEWHYCGNYPCNGWVEGDWEVRVINTLRPRSLAGKKGKRYCCRRCGSELGFVGVVSYWSLD